jgi:hypothetical protein
MDDTTLRRIPVLEYDSKICAFNVRVTDRWVVSSQEDYPHTWTAGWCYDKGGSALHAALLWDPDTEDAPAGFKKLAADSRAPRR